MHLFSIIDIDVTSMIVLAIILYFVRKKLCFKPNPERFVVFSWLIVFTLIMLFLEISSLILPIFKVQSLVLFSQLINGIGFAICPVIPLLWTIQLKTLLNIDYNLKFILIPTVINLILCLFNWNYHFIFSITSANGYLRGPLFILPALFAYTYIIYYFILLLKYRKLMTRKEFVTFLIFVSIPALASLFQVFYQDIIIIWSSSAITITLFYVYLQETTLTHDPLTHAQNRLGFESQISAYLSSNTPHFSTILIDLDYFKSINDTYGHHEGDEALITVVSLLKQSFKDHGEVFRIGGDEFIILLPTSDPKVVNAHLSKFKVQVAAYNASHKKPYTLEFSYGYGPYSSSFLHFHDYMIYLDQLMYTQKNQKKAIEG